MLIIDTVALIIIFLKKMTTIKILTSFSYLFCLFSFLFLIFSFILKGFDNKIAKYNLAFKIQIALNSLIIISLFFFSLSSGLFIKEQYNDYSFQLIKEKIKAIEESLNYKNTSKNIITIDEDGENLNTILKKYANVFQTDINMYDLNGYLLASSRQKLFNLGLQSEQINPIAFNQLKWNKKSEFLQNESIGELNYVSAYFPVFNQNGKLLTFINLQHFGQQKDIENQMEEFLNSIINIFILLFVLSVVLALFVSNWLTKPLKFLQLSLSNIEMGKYNKPIIYDSNDEIGELVKNYNHKLSELAFTANQLAQTEREMAWREMA